MIPATWAPHHRADDDELVGYVVPQTDGRHVPVTTFGYPLADPTDLDDAAAILESRGLAVLTDRWLLQLDDRTDPIAVSIGEVTPERITVRNADFGYAGDIGTPFVLAVPVDRRLRPER